MKRILKLELLCLNKLYTIIIIIIIIIVTLIITTGTPKVLTVNEVESTQNSIRIVWSSPERQPDERPILSYLLQYKKVEEGANLWQNISVVKNNSTVSVTVENLKIGTEYIIRIFARNIVGYSQVPTLVETSTKEYGKLTFLLIKNLVLLYASLQIWLFSVVSCSFLEDAYFPLQCNTCVSFVLPSCFSRISNVW